MIIPHDPPFRRLVIVDPTLKAKGGHDHLYTSEMARYARRAGLSVMALVSKQCDPELAAELNAIPHFAFSINTPISAPKAYFYYQAWLTMNQRFDEELERCNLFGIGRHDLLVLHTATESNSYGLYTWYSRLPENNRPYVLLELHNPNHLQPTDRRDRGIAIEMIKRSLGCWGELPPTRVLIGATNAKLARFLSDHAGTSVRVLPPIVRAGPSPAVSEARSPLTFAYLGQARPGKGFHLIAEMILRDEGELDGIHFLIQAHTLYAIDGRVIEKLARKANVTLIQTTLGENDYDEVMSRADAMLVYYMPSEYRASVSNVFFESLRAGLPAVVAPGTTMADMISEGNAPGVVGEAFDVSALKRAVLRMAGEFTAQKAAAIAHAHEQRHSSDIDNFMTDVLDHFVGRAAGVKGD